MKKPNFPLKGGCACGAVRYEIAAPPLAIYACHCTDCQRRTGTAFALNMPVRTSSLRIVAGAPKGWRSASSNGATATSWFCGDCGGRIYGERDGRPDIMVIRAGTLDDTSWVRPAAHFFVRSAQPWERFDQPFCFDTIPEDPAIITRLWNDLWRQK
jgi:hypothetical protein